MKIVLALLLFPQIQVRIKLMNFKYSIKLRLQTKLNYKLFQRKLT